METPSCTETRVRLNRTAKAELRSTSGEEPAGTNRPNTALSPAKRPSLRGSNELWAAENANKPMT